MYKDIRFRIGSLIPTVAKMDGIANTRKLRGYSIIRCPEAVLMSWRSITRVILESLGGRRRLSSSPHPSRPLEPGPTAEGLTHTWIRRTSIRSRGPRCHQYPEHLGHGSGVRVVRTTTGARLDCLRTLAILTSTMLHRTARGLPAETRPRCPSGPTRAQLDSLLIGTGIFKEYLTIPPVTVNV